VTYSACHYKYAQINGIRGLHALAQLISYSLVNLAMMMTMTSVVCTAGQGIGEDCGSFQPQYKATENTIGNRFIRNQLYICCRYLKKSLPVQL